MAPQKPVSFVLGAHTFGDRAIAPGIVHFDRSEDVRTVLDIAYERGIREIDTAANYPTSELRLGQNNAPVRFAISTKVAGGGERGSHEPDKVEASIKKSLEELGVDSVDTFYLHVPDRQTPLEDVMKVMNDSHKKGQFKRLGVSNYSAAEVTRMLEICEEKGYVKPTAYQGQYNAIARGGEKELFPLLREKGIAFYAYSPAAGGLFSGQAGKTSDSARWSKENAIGQVYTGFYDKPLIQASVSTIIDAAAKHGITGHAAALRWTAFHSVLDGTYGDGVIFAASNLEQLRKTLDALDAGPLPAELVKAFSALNGATEGSGIPYHL
ncbi:Aldo/keto reductase [Xylariaceae sp. FL0804]|nr:Aldo/keto reductase [Xylariaceae sp. FL0804]